MSTAQQRALVQAPDPSGSSVTARCQALGLARSSFYSGFVNGSVTFQPAVA